MLAGAAIAVPLLASPAAAEANDSFITFTMRTVGRPLVYLGGKYNGNGAAAPPVVFDPYTGAYNVSAGDGIHLKVCLVDGNNDQTPSYCAEVVSISRDG